MKTFIVILMGAVLVLAAYADILNVPGDYPTIQAAVNAANNGDDIIVAPGIYGPVYIDSLFDISLTGAGFLEPYKTVIDGGDNTRGIEVHDCYKIIISGFEIRNCWEECINLIGCTEVYVLDNYLHDCNDYVGDGLHLSECEDVLVKRNIIVDNRYSGIYINAYPPPPGPWCVNVNIINNTIAYNYMIHGIIIAYDDSGFVCKNNIIAFNDEYGIRYKLQTQTYGILDYNDVYANGYGGWSNCSPGDSTICEDPLFTGGTGAEAYFLLPTSPCIDAGDPEMLDPDSTRSDIGALYYHQGPGMGLEITLTPINFPPVIPSTGGTYQYGVRIENTTPAQQIFDAWIKLTIPYGQAINPLILRQGLQLEGGEQIVRYPSLTIPFLAMPGTYALTGFVGQYPFFIMDSSRFSFEKEPFDGPESGSTAQWTLSGWGETEHFTTPVQTPIEHGLTLHATPNPFNPETTVSYYLPQSGEVTIKAYDVLGREAATLVSGYQSAGAKTVVWNAEELSSGIYFIHLTSNNEQSIKRVLLIK